MTAKSENLEEASSLNLDMIGEKSDKYGDGQLAEDQYVPVQSILLTHEKAVEWLVVQFELYSSLCKGRNLVWKLFMEEILTPEFLFDAVWDNSYMQLRTPLYNLLISMYIDQDPLYDIKYPEFLTVLHEGIDRHEYGQTHKLRQKLVKDEKLPKQMFKPLIVNLDTMIKSRAKSLKKEVKNLLKDHKDHSGFDHSFHNLDLNEIAELESLVGIFNLVDLLMKMDVHELFNETKSLKVLSKSCLKILEFSINYPDLMPRLSQIRKNNQKERNGILKIFHKDPKIEDKVVISSSYKANQKGYTDNPLIQNFSYVKNHLNRELHNYLNKNNETEKVLKLKIVGIMNKIFDKRHNFLIQNAISWVQNLGTNYIQNKEEYETLLKMKKDDNIDISD